MGAMIFALLGILGLAAAAGTAKAQPTPTPTPTRRPTRAPTVRPARARPVSRVRTVRPKRKVRVRRARKISRPLTKRAKKAIRKLKTAKIRPGSSGAAFLKNLFKIAAARRGVQHPLVRKAAKKKIKEIAVKPAPARAEAIKKMPPAAKRKVAEAVVKAETTTPPTPAQAARALQVYTKEGGWQGTKKYRSHMVRNSQDLMGIGPGDGIIGPGTRKRAKELGFPLYRRSHQKPGAWRTGTYSL